jgi:hypothetical protein
LETVQKILNSNEFDLEKFALDFNEFNEKLKESVNKIKTVNEVSIIEGIDISDVLEAASSNSSQTPNFQPILFNGKFSEEVCLLKNSIKHLTRAILVSADRVVSKLSQKELADIFEIDDIDNSLLISNLVNLITEKMILN